MCNIKLKKVMAKVIIMKLLGKVNKIFESRHKGMIDFSHREIYLIDFSSEIMEVRKKQQEIFQIHQEKA